MKFIKGEFFENGVKVPIEFGNKKQIKLIEYIEALREGILCVNNEVNCPCGESVLRTDPQCNVCFNVFKFYNEFDDYGILKIPCVKLISK